MSDMLKDPMVLRSIIMDHYEYPRNHGLKDDANYHSVHMASESCIDDIHVQCIIEDNILKDIRFDGVACTISTASTSIMSELLMDKSVDEANAIIQSYYDMIAQKGMDADVLQEAVAFQSVGKQANRIHCATIGWDAIKQLIQQGEHHEK